jgi:hypothetical protein
MRVVNPKNVTSTLEYKGRGERLIAIPAQFATRSSHGVAAVNSASPSILIFSMAASTLLGNAITS